MDISIHLNSLETPRLIASTINEDKLTFFPKQEITLLEME